MVEPLLTKQDVATIFQISPITVDRWVASKIIPTVKGLPSVRFNPQQIAALMGTKIDKLSPLERKRLEKEKEELSEKVTDLERENTELKDYVKSVIGSGVRFIELK